MTDVRGLLERLQQAFDAHDVEALVACFDENYESSQPVHPARTFRGRNQVRKNWTALFESIPDFRSEFVRTAVDGDTVWVEIHWTGTKGDGSPFEERGVIIFGVRDDRVAWARLYGDEVEQEGADIDAVVRQMTGTS